MSILRVCRSSWPAARLHFSASMAFATCTAGRGNDELDAKYPMAMPLNWDRLEDDWKQLSGKVQEKWGKLTDDDLAFVNGKREQLEGRIQERYGYGKDQVKKELDDWSATL